MNPFCNAVHSKRNAWLSLFPLDPSFYFGMILRIPKTMNGEFKTLPGGSAFVRWFAWLSLGCLSFESLAFGDEVDFGREVLPLLSDRCFKCHGPDASARKAELRLDRSMAAHVLQTDQGVIVPGKPEQSEVYRRITSRDPDERMPPLGEGEGLTPEEQALIGRWIREGARWEGHWAFRSVKRPDLPEVHRREWARNPIDYFVLAGLEENQLEPSPEASPAQLRRRVGLGLLGLPPVTEPKPERYESYVNRLLASPAYGERMGQMWLDLARYADTSGYQNDGPRSMWRWRDWVIDALNANQPFDEFSRDQLAGDLLSEPTLEQRIATGFNRNHRGNAEGGIVPEEYAVEYVVDRVETFGTVWLGLTVGCARCHDHKYDPITQREFYQLFAFFNSIPESGRAIKEGNSPPFIKAPTAFQRQQLAALDVARRAAGREVDRLAEAREEAQLRWEKAGEFDAIDTLPQLPGLVQRLSFDAERSVDEEGVWEEAETEIVESFIESRGQARQFNGQSEVRAENVGAYGYFDRFTISLWAKADGGNGTLWSRMIDVSQGTGYSLDMVEGRLRVNLVKRWLDDAIRIESDRMIDLGRWYHIAVVYDGSRVAAGIRVYLDGEELVMRTRLDALNQSFLVENPFRLGQGNFPFVGELDEFRLYDRDLGADEIAMLSVASDSVALIGRAGSARTSAESALVAHHFLMTPAGREFAAAATKRWNAEQAYRALLDGVPTSMVMEELPEARPARVLNRGRYDQPGERVERGVPGHLPAFPQGVTKDRLGLAEWLTMEANPLTARVMVNRLWQFHFGEGLVRTPENFGVQGEGPTHPELLDWLAAELMESGWDLKHLHRLILTSATYRQGSHWTPELLERDPSNRHLARGPRFRLSAEVLRDRALAVSGLMVDTIGGPSVKPYQPEGLWKEIASDTVYDVARGEGLYRRSLYTYWKRTVSPPLMAALDAPSREACVVLRSRTNTPLQALGLMNETGYLEAAKGLARLAHSQAGPEKRDRIAYAFELALNRELEAAELARLIASFERFERDLNESPERVDALLSVGRSQVGGAGDRVALAALMLICHTLFNLDEFVTLD